MSTPTIRKARRKAWALVVALAAAFGVFLTAGTANASPFTCTFDSTTGFVSIQMAAETVTVKVGNLSRINVNGAPCVDPVTLVVANVNNTAQIQVDDVTDTGLSNLVIDLGGGQFAPGFNNVIGTDETAASANEIEWYIGWVASVTVLGSAAPDTIYVGDGVGVVDPAANGGLPIINLNGDDDADVYNGGAGAPLGGFVNAPADPTSLVAIGIAGNGGPDTLDATGSHGTGGPSPLVVFLALDGGDGNDTLNGGLGNDWLAGGPGDDFINGGGSGEDPLTGSNCAIVWEKQITGSPIPGFPDPLPQTGDLHFILWTGDTVSYALSTGPITLDLDPNESAIGTATGDGTDTIVNVENVDGSPGSDTLSGDNADNIIAGEAGDDTVAGDAGFDCELGNDGNDTFDENEGTSAAQGGTGTDNGSDLMLGNAGLDDAVKYDQRTTRVVVYLEQLPAVSADSGPVDNTWDRCLVDTVDVDGTLLGGIPINDGADVTGDGDSFDFVDENDCVFLDTENVTTGSGNDILDANWINNRADNELTDGAGNDLNMGGAGNDTFHQGAAAQGSDDMDGGTGSDTCDYSGRPDAVSVALDGNDNDGGAGEGDNCGGVIGFTFFGQVLTAARAEGLFPGEGQPSTQENVENINAGSGNDILTGSGEANIINGNTGNDWTDGSGGNDVMNGGDGTDWVDYQSSGAGVTVNLAQGTASGAGSDTLSAQENVNGSNFSDILTGDGNANVVNGRGGNDQLKGNAGGDTLNGGAGNDTANGGADDDAVNGQGGKDNLRGAGGDDTLNGGAGADTLFGGAGDDSLFGGAGKDDHRGGPGTDSCRPGQPGLGHGDTASGCEA
jgi:Ca2+-binding RTX toxin-like protein